MENLEQTIQAVLNDPEQMKSIMDMAKTLGFSPPDSEERAPNDAVHDALPLAQLLSQQGGLEKRQENLLNAIKPFLNPVKQEKIDRAMQVARLSHLAGYALRSREQKDE